MRQLQYSNEDQLVLSDPFVMHGSVTSLGRKDANFKSILTQTVTQGRRSRRSWFLLYLVRFP